MKVQHQHQSPTVFAMNALNANWSASRMSNEASGRMPDRFDRLLAGAEVSTKPHPHREAGLLGVGGSTLFIVQTGRTDANDTVFLQVEDENTHELRRVVIPASILSVIDRQRAYVLKQARRRHGRSVMAQRKANATK